MTARKPAAPKRPAARKAAPAAKPKGKPGRPRIPFDGSDSDKVRLLKMAGTKHEIIAALLGCSEDTLGRRFREELKVEPIHGYALVDATLIGLALDGQLEAIKWLDVSRRGMRPTTRHELTGADGAPIEHKDLSRYSDEQLAAIERAANILVGADDGADE